jgi:uncharacterized membrane protein
MVCKKSIYLILNLCFFSLFAYSVSADHGARLLLTPSTGTFVVGSTFNVSLLLDTNNTDANAIEAHLSFPPNILQVISSSAGKSVIDLWSVPPRFNNMRGAVELQGIITGGLNASDALITTLTFRVRGTGSAIIKITDDSRVLRHDGAGSDFLQHQRNSIYTLMLPPPAGPLVVSETHPDQQQWYKDSNISLAWSFAEGGTADGYSYMVNSLPIDAPDNISEGAEQSVLYQNPGDGTKYFHIKALRNGIWGGVTHFAFTIDTQPPAEFPIEINPGARTSAKQPVILFATTDALSGVDHYELKIIPITPSLSAAVESSLSYDQNLFIEAQSPYVAHPLEYGTYDIIVRAYDKAGNFYEAVRRLTIRKTFLGFSSYDGLEIDGLFVIPWSWIIILLIILLAVLGYKAVRVRRKEQQMRTESLKNTAPEVRKELLELKKYREKYGKLGVFLLLATACALSGRDSAHAYELRVEPPLVTSISRDISNQDIFYVGGKTNIPNSTVVFYLQNMTTGETGSFEVVSNEYGDWFYAHNTFLSSGEYLLWAQSKIGEAASPPSAREDLVVRPTAIQYGSSRLAYDTLYIFIIIALSLFIIALGVVLMRARRRMRNHQERMRKEIREAKEAVQTGFAVLRRDIEAELAAIDKIKMEKNLREEEKEREAQLLADLADIERRIGKEVWDIELSESN